VVAEAAVQPDPVHPAPTAYELLASDAAARTRPQDRNNHRRRSPQAEAHDGATPALRAARREALTRGADGASRPGEALATTGGRGAARRATTLTLPAGPTGARPGAGAGALATSREAWHLRRGRRRWQGRRRKLRWWREGRRRGKRWWRRQRRRRWRDGRERDRWERDGRQRHRREQAPPGNPAAQRHGCRQPGETGQHQQADYACSSRQTPHLLPEKRARARSGYGCNGGAGDRTMHA
jgi:hypothetical protein